MATTDIAQKNARRRVDMFKRDCDQREHGSEIFRLACHAALPVVLNAELLHLVRINFFLDTSEPLSYTDESDLLLSPICQEIGADLYEIEAETRMLLRELVKDEQYGHTRIRELAGLLWQYVDQRSPWEEHIHLKRAQQLTALNFLNPKKAKAWLAEAEESSGYPESGLKDWFVAMYKELQRSAYLEQRETTTGKGRPVIHLRSEPLTVSDDEFKAVFGLDKNRRPLEYIRNDFENRGEVVVDHATGLMWQKSGSDDYMSYEEAQEYVKKLNRQKFAGYENWRLPTIPELMSLLEPERQSNDLYINPIFDKKQWWCRSADKRQIKDEDSAKSSWLVYFVNGYVHWNFLNYESYVRCVRSGQ